MVDLVDADRVATVRILGGVEVTPTVLAGVGLVAGARKVVMMRR